MHKKNIVAKESKSEMQILIDGVQFDSFDDYINLTSMQNLYSPNLPASTVLTTTLPLTGADQDWAVAQFNKKAAEETSTVAVSSILEQDQYRSIMKAISRLSTQLKEQHVETKEKLDIIIAENVELRGLLSKKYSAKSLFFYSVTASLSLLISLVVWFQFGIVIIHPALAAIVLIGTIGFSGLSAWRIKKHE